MYVNVDQELSEAGSCLLLGVYRTEKLASFLPSSSGWQAGIATAE